MTTSPSRGHRSVDVALFNAVRSNDVEGVRAALKQGANVNYRGGLFAERPLHVAASKRSAAITAILLENGANVNAVCERRNTALHEAVISNSLQVVLLLCEAGANMNLKNKTGARPAALVKQKRSLDPSEARIADEILKYLKSNGSYSVDTPNKSPEQGTPPPKQPLPKEKQKKLDAHDRLSAYARWFEGLRDEKGEVTWKAIQDDMRFAESLVKNLKAAGAGTKHGVVTAEELLPMLVPDLRKPDVSSLPELKENASILADPAGWVSAHFPTPDAIRAAWAACRNGTVARILSSRVRLLDAKNAPPCDDTQDLHTVSASEVDVSDIESEGSSAASPPNYPPPVL